MRVQIFPRTLCKYLAAVLKFDQCLPQQQPVFLSSTACSVTGLSFNRMVMEYQTNLSSLSRLSHLSTNQIQSFTSAT